MNLEACGEAVQLDLELDHEPETRAEAVQRALRLSTFSAMTTVDWSAKDNVVPLNHLGNGMITASPYPPAAPTALTPPEPVADDGLTPTDFVVWLAGAVDLEHGAPPSPAQWQRIVTRARAQVSGVARSRFAKRGVYNPLTKY